MRIGAPILLSYGAVAPTLARRRIGATAICALPVDATGPRTIGPSLCHRRTVRTGAASGTSDIFHFEGARTRFRLADIATDVPIAIPAGPPPSLRYPTCRTATAVSMLTSSVGARGCRARCSTGACARRSGRPFRAIADALRDADKPPLPSPPATSAQLPPERVFYRRVAVRASVGDREQQLYLNFGQSGTRTLPRVCETGRSRYRGDLDVLPRWRQARGGTRHGGNEGGPVIRLKDAAQIRIRVRRLTIAHACCAPSWSPHWRCRWPLVASVMCWRPNSPPTCKA